MTSIIDMIYMSPNIEALNTWVIDPKPAKPSDHDGIVYDLADEEGEVGSMGTS